MTAPAPSEWMDTTETAALMGTSVGKIRHWCRLNLFPQYTSRAETGRFQIRRAALDDRKFWTAVTGSRDARRYGPGWTGPRVSPKMEGYLARHGVTPTP